MSVNAIGAVSLAAQQKSQPKPAAPAPDVTPFSQQLDTQTAQAGATHGHHHHGGGGAKSVTSSASTAASAAGITPGSSVISSLMHLLS
jgi:hypothetical protein